MAYTVIQGAAKYFGRSLLVPLLIFLFHIPFFNIAYAPEGNRYWHGTTPPTGKGFVSSVTFFLIHSKCKWNGSTANNWLLAFGSAFPFHAELLDAHLSYGNQDNCTREAPFSYKPSSFPSVTRITKGEALSNLVLPYSRMQVGFCWLDRGQVTIMSRAWKLFSY